MEKKQKVAPEGEPPLKQFSVCKTNPFGQTNSVFGAAHTPPPFGPSCSPAFGSSMPAFGSSSTPAFGSSSTSFGGSSGFGQKNLKEVEATRTNIQKLLKEIGSSGFGQKPQKLDYREFTYPTNINKLFKEVAHLGSSDPTMRHQLLEAVGFFDASFQIWKQSFQATPFQRATQLGLGSAPAFGAISLTYSISSRQIITEEDKRFESWFAIAGADYCVIAADFTGDHTNISQLSGKCVMASCGVQANVKNLQKILCAENLKYECQHKKQLSCVKMERLFRHHHLLSDPIPRSLCGFILLGGLDSKGKGCFFRPLRPGCVYFPDSGLGPTVPPIFKFKLPAEDVVARMSETEAVALAKEVFKFATNTGDKLEIVVLNASGIRSECVDLKTGDKLGIVVPNASGQVLSRKRKRSSSV